MLRKLYAAGLVLVCAAAISVFYHYTIRIPAEARMGEEFRRGQANVELSRRCREDGMRYFQESVLAENNPPPPTPWMWDPPEFHFSRKLNTCLVHIRGVRESPSGMRSYHSNRVVDVYGNKPLFFGEFVRDLSVEPPQERPLDPMQGVPNYSSARYVQEMRKLFSE